jgi:thiaminase
MASQSFWDAAANLISITENHPFLVAMVNGSLNYDNFRYYVIQDALYLTDYATCLHMLGDKLSSMDEPTKAKKLHQFAVGAEEDEKEMHRTFFKDWGDMDMTHEKAMPSTREFCNPYNIMFTGTLQAG